ncbi:MAG: MBL fold metallo-hydrolase [Clostridia bacterium]|nr:MBL fold metallo-hydrolase [Clostridia bacterium]
MKRGKLRLLAVIFSAAIVASATAFGGCDMLLDYLPFDYDIAGGSSEESSHSHYDSTSSQDSTGSSSQSDSSSEGDGSSGTETEIAEGAKEDIITADFSIHFLELGNKYTGDCTLIKCGDTEVLIDAGSRQGSATTLKSYIDQYCTDGVLEYVIVTHSDQDHIAGFYGNKSGDTRTGIFYQYEIETIIMYNNSNATSQIAPNVESAISSLSANGTTVYTASQCYDEEGDAKRQYYLDDEQTVSMNILYSYYYYNESDDNNNHSVVMLLTQETADGNLNYLFTGDLEEDGESRMVDYYADSTNSKSEYDVLPKVELYKAGHHGSKTSSTAKLLAVIQPKNIAVCCCCGSPEYTTNNDNTFPTQTMITNASKYTENIYVTTLADIEDFENKKYSYTSMNGNIVFYYSKSEDEEEASLKLWCSNNTTKLKDTEWFKENRTWG